MYVKEVPLRFIAISDTHCRHHNVKLPKGDVLLHAGDVSYKGQKTEILDFLKWFAELKFQYKIFIAGNHDFFFENKPSREIEELMPAGVTYLNDTSIIIDGITIWGSPVTPWFFNWAFNRRRGMQIMKHWNLIPANTDILLTHGPVYGIHDSVINGVHVGCVDLLKKVKEIKPPVHVCGHIHEAYGQLKRGETKFINASLLNERYELVQKPVVFDFKK
jgi:Icc-related predicted phosphoesterase